MRNFIIVLSIFFFASCGFYFDRPIERIMSVHNFTDEAIYVYYSYIDSLQLTPKLELFLYLPNRAPEVDGLDPYCSPEYRINPHTSSEIAEKYDYEKIWNPFPDHPEIDYVFFFFIKESTLKNNSWEQIVEKQLYEKKVKYRYKELERLKYEISYKP